MLEVGGYSFSRVLLAFRTWVVVIPMTCTELELPETESSPAAVGGVCHPQGRKAQIVKSRKSASGCCEACHWRSCPVTWQVEVKPPLNRERQECGKLSRKGAVTVKRVMLLALVLLLVTGCTGTKTGNAGNGATQGGKDQLPPPNIGEFRDKVTYPIFYPTQAPESLRPVVQLRESGVVKPLVEINYLDKGGTSQLHVLNGTVGCCLDSDPRKTGESVKIRDNITAHYLVNQPEFGGPILWWQETGSYVALSGPTMNKDSLVAIANSMVSSSNP